MMAETSRATGVSRCLLRLPFSVSRVVLLTCMSLRTARRSTHPTSAGTLSSRTRSRATNYVRWPRASTPDRWHARMHGTSEFYTRQSTKLWCTIAAADALDAREAAKPHRGFDAAACCGAPFRQSAISTYAAEPEDRSETPMPVTCLPSSLPLSSPLSPPSPPRLPPEREDGGGESYLYTEAPEYLYMPWSTCTCYRGAQQAE